jgi:DNA-directed RNA polymerase alpha subunit
VIKIPQVHSAPCNSWYAFDAALRDVALSIRASNCLYNYDIWTFDKFRALKESEVRQWRQCGSITVREIMDEVKKVKEMRITPWFEFAA